MYGAYFGHWNTSFFNSIMTLQELTDQGADLIFYPDKDLIVADIEQLSSEELKG